MARRNVQFEKNGYYHIYNRGCNREDIFQSEENYFYLLRKLKEKVIEYDIAVISYCLMPNHYHFLLRQGSSKSVESLVQWLFNVYTKAFNAMYKRSGTLFEGPFKSLEIKKDSHLLHLCRYIHRNPLDAGLVAKIEDWKFSNYMEWIGKREDILVDLDFVQEHYASPEEYKEFVLDYVSPKHIEREMKKYYCE
jgi:REP element-mobilizing transposase RayT